MLRWLMMLLVLVLPASAQAEWREAVTRHFMVSSEGTDQQLRQSAEDLERYDYLLRLMLDLPQESPNKLKIYLLRDSKAVQAALGYGGGMGVAGFYEASPRGSIAVGSRKNTGGTQWDLPSQVILFHEYAHHIMLQHSEVMYPAWYREGFAEYYGTTQILPGNVMEVGHAPRHRMVSFRGRDVDWISMKELLTARNYDDIDGRVGMLYSQGWLLVHYLANNETRAKQLRTFLAAVNSGVDEKTAMDEAFGTDAAELNKELRLYAKKQRMEGMRITFPSIDVGDIQTRALSPAEAALIERDIQLNGSVYARDAAEFAKEVRAITDRFPGDAKAASILAEAELAAENCPAAMAAADQWLAIEPTAPRALAVRTKASLCELKKSKSADAKAWQAARKWVTDAYKAAPFDPLVLETFYDSHAAPGVVPPARAQNALFKAMALVPQDSRLRYKVAADFEGRGMIAPAIEAIRPAAYRSHAPKDESERERAKRNKLEDKWRLAGDERTESLREMLARLEAKLPKAEAAASAR